MLRLPDYKNLELFREPISFAKLFFFNASVEDAAFEAEGELLTGS